MTMGPSPEPRHQASSPCWAYPIETPPLRISELSIYWRDETPVVWVGSAHEDLRTFPKAARRKAGHELHQVQIGLLPSDWKPVSAVGPGTIEIRTRTREAGGRVEHRVFLVAKFEEAISVLHAFQKTSRKTRKRDIEIGRKRYRRMLRDRKASQHLFGE